MTRSCILFCLLLCNIVFIKAQTPANIVTTNVLTHENGLHRSSIDCDDQFGGNIALGTITAQSNDIDLDVSFLCFGDEFEILNTNANLTGDPEPLTLPGIGYVFYDCPPTVSGPTKIDILGDPCLNQTDPVIIGGTVLNLDDFWITRGQPNGDITFGNTGSLQEGYGNGGPVQLWFAPITLHEFDNGGLEAGDASCVHVNVAESFSVVFLNEIVASNFQTTVNGNGCTGSFLIEGGMPEFDGLVYGIDIFLTSNPDISGTLATGSTSNTHGETVEFFVPQPGEYTIQVVDSKDCSTSFTINMENCSSITLTASDEEANPGEEVCFTISTENFTDVLSLQFSFAYDETLLQYNSAGNFNLLGLDANGFFNPNPGQITFNWFDPYFTGQTLPNGTPVFELCFTVIGNGIFMTELEFTGVPTPVEAVDVNGDPIGIILNNGNFSSFSDLNVVTNTDSVSCGGLADGSFDIIVTGGMEPYSFTWQEIPGGTISMPIEILNSGGTSVISGLSAGMYSFTITDNSVPAIQYTETLEIMEEPPIFVNITGTNPSCPGDSDGSMEITFIGGGVPPMGIEWSTGAMDVTQITGLGQGAYAVTITDTQGCTQTALNSIGVNPVQITSTALNHVSCQGNGSDGSIMISAIGGSGTYTFMWDNGEMGASINNLLPGMYSVTATDDNACSSMETFTINAPEVPLITSFDDDTVSCPNSTDGSLTIVVEAVNSPIATYVWSPDAGSTATVNNLAPGIYSVTVTAEDGCLVEASAEVAGPAPLVIADTLITLPTCPGTDVPPSGLIGLTIAGGTEPYSFFWDNGATNATNPALYGNQDYCVTITDANNCPPLEACITLDDPPSIGVVFSDEEIVSCNGQSADGQATATAFSGTGDGTYSFIWSSGETTAGTSMSTAVNLAQGMQTVTVSDDMCFIVDTVEIGAPEPLAVATNFQITEPTCFGDTDGSGTIQANGGTPPYEYFWENGDTGPTIQNIGAGEYRVTILDFNGCILLFKLTVDEPELLQTAIFPDQTLDVSCNRESDGQIVVITEGGTGAYQYTWTNNVSNSSEAINLPTGTYGVTVNDANGCSAETVASVSEPPPIIPSIPDIEEPLCFGQRTVVTVDTAVGGNGELYTFSVNGGPRQNRGNLVRIPGGREHEIRVYDGEDCFMDTTIFVGQPAEVIVDLGPDVEIQLGDSIRLQPSLFVPLSIDSVVWTPLTDLSCNTTDCLRPFVSPLKDQTYNLTIYDTNGCVGSDDIIVNVDKNRNVYIPNIFSPNGDGRNDEFRVHIGPGVRNINYFQVFDRWGEILYEKNNFFPSDNFGSGWNGRMNGKVLNPGVFVYLIEVVFEDDITLLYRGDVTLIY